MWDRSLRVSQSCRGWASFRKDLSEGSTENIPVGGGLGSGHESGGYWRIQARDILA